MADCGIYAIRQIGTDRLYIGSSVRMKTRFGQHRKLLNAGRHHSYFMQHAWMKYGADAFEFVHLEYCERDDLLAREQHYIDMFTPAFNYAKVAGSRLGVPVSQETREQISQTMRGRAFTAEHRANISAAHRASPAAQAQFNRIQKQARTPEIHEKISAAQRGKPRPWQIGHDVSAETRAKISSAQAGKSRPWQAGRPRSPETREKIAAAQRGKPRPYARNSPLILAKIQARQNRLPEE